MVREQRRPPRACIIPSSTPACHTNVVGYEVMVRRPSTRRWTWFGNARQIYQMVSLKERRSLGSCFKSTKSRWFRAAGVASCTFKILLANPRLGWICQSVCIREKSCRLPLVEKLSVGGIMELLFLCGTRGVRLFVRKRRAMAHADTKMTPGSVVESVGDIELRATGSDFVV